MKTNERSELLLGKEALEALNDKTVLVVGVGGVGSFCVEALARTGIGHLILIDKDCVEPSNINRQLVATLDTVNEVKVDVLKKRISTLNDKTVLVVGVGGVGSFCVEALARTGIGHLILIDKDCVEPSNINRQLVATLDTVNEVKVDVLKKRISTLNPNCIVDTYACFYDQTKDDEIFSQPIDFVVDCIDSIQSKKDLMQACIERNIPFLSSMGMARRKDPTKLVVTEVEKTSYDPMAKQIRQWKRKNRIRNKIWVVASLEQPIPVESGQPLPSAIFVPASAGLVLASECVQRLIES